MKWFLFWAIAATANNYSQPEQEFTSKAECQRHAQAFHKSLDADMMTLAIAAMLRREVKGEAEGEDPSITDKAVAKINSGTAHAMVKAHRKFTLICKQEQKTI